MEVLDVDILVWCSLALAPEKETLFGGGFLDGDVLDGESKDNGPDHTQSHFNVAVDDFLGTNWDEADTLGLDKVKGLVDVGDLVEAHLATVGLGEALAGDDLEEEHKFETISEVDINGLDTGTSFAEVGVAPSGECLKSEL